MTAPRVADLDTVTSLFVRRCLACGAIDHTSAFGRRARDGAPHWSCPRCCAHDVEWLEVVVP